MNAQLADNPSSGMLPKLRQRARELSTKIARYEQHLKQYAACRDEVKRSEAALVYGDGKCVLYRDFVNCYNEAGQKVKNLVHSFI